MKKSLKKMLGMAVLGMTLLTNAAPLLAGSRSAQEVGVYNDKGFHYANGSMVGARYSTDATQNIGCTAYALSTYTWTSCFATNRLGNTLVCGSGDPRWAEVVQGLTDSSYIHFEAGFNGNGGACNVIWVQNQSSQLR